MNKNAEKKAGGGGYANRNKLGKKEKQDQEMGKMQKGEKGGKGRGGTKKGITQRVGK